MPTLNFADIAFEIEVLLVLQGFTAQFVTKEQYQQLLFVLGQKGNSSTVDLQNYKVLLKLFNDFHTNSVDNFKDMMTAFEFPFVYDENKSLPENRCDFKDFFLI